MRAPKYFAGTKQIVIFRWEDEGVFLDLRSISWSFEQLTFLASKRVTTRQRRRLGFRLDGDPYGASANQLTIAAAHVRPSATLTTPGVIYSSPLIILYKLGPILDLRCFS